MSEELVAKEFFVFCEHKQVYLKRMRRAGRWVVVACEDKARQVELAWVDALEIWWLIQWHERGDMMCPTRLMSISYRKMVAVRDLVVAVPYAVHAASPEDFWAAYAKDHFINYGQEQREFDLTMFNQWGYIDFPKYKHSLRYERITYIGPFHGDTEWWFGKGEVK